MSQHRKFTPEFKARIVLDLLSGRRSSAELCRQHEISATLLAPWKDTLVQPCSALRWPLPARSNAHRRPLASPSWSGWSGV